jgi:hypothetical protein
VLQTQQSSHAHCQQLLLPLQLGEVPPLLLLTVAIHAVDFAAAASWLS